LAEIESHHWQCNLGVEVATMAEVLIFWLLFWEQLFWEQENSWVVLQQVLVDVVARRRRRRRVDALRSSESAIASIQPQTSGVSEQDATPSSSNF
jgi:hypothetical protein